MLNNKFISCKTIIAKLYRDLKLKEEEAYVDFIENMAEALEFIHVYPQYKVNKACVKIKNHKGELPCDYISMIAVEHNGFSLTYSSNVMGPDFYPEENYPSDTPYSVNRKKIENAVFIDPEMINYFQDRQSIQIENGYIKTSFNKGMLNIVYVSMILDEEGFPMIPDNVSFREALYWYCTYKYLYPKALTGDINPQFYNDAYQKWLWYCNQAGAEALMPDLLMLENIKKSFLRLKPSFTINKSFYNGLNK